ncbi:reverse transcriptase domain-containing protein, partial [Tanacetum coccineum]
MTLKRRNRRRSKQRIELFSLEETSIVTMADQRTMAELLQAPTEGYEDAIVIPAILAENFKLKHGLLNLFEETFSEVRDRFKDLLCACPHHGFTKLHQLDTFYNALNPTDQDSLNAAAGGNLLTKTPRDSLTIIENKLKVRNLRNKPVVSKVSANTSSSTTACPSEMAALTDVVNAMIRHVKTSPLETVKAIYESCVTCGGPHPYYECLVADGNTFNASAATTTYNQNQGYRPQGETNYLTSNQMGPPSFPPVQNNQNCFNQNHGYNQNRGNNFNQGNENYQAPPQVGPSNDLSNYMKTNDVNMRVMQNQISNMRTKLKKEMDTTLSRQDNAFKNELRNELTNDIKNMMSSFFQMNTASSSGSGSLPSNTVANPRGDLKAITTQNGFSYDGPPILPPFSPLPKVVEREPEVIKDTVQPSTENIQPPVVQIQAPIDEPVVAPKPKPSIPYPSRANKQKLQIVECLALADLGASINLMPLSIWKKLSLPELTPTRIILVLADRSTTSPSGIAEDVFVKEGKFHFLADFIVVDYVVDPRVPLILGRPFLRTARALIDVYGEELTLQVDDEAITFKYAQEVLGFSDSSTSGNPTPSLDPILSTSFSSLTPFEGGDFILEEIEACLTNDSIPPGIDDADFDPEGDLLLLEKLLKDDPSSPLPPKELHFEDIKTIKSSIDDPPELELKDLPSHLEYAFLKGTDKLPVIISKELKDEEKVALLKVLKSHKRAIAWKIFDIKGIDPSFNIKEGPWVSPVHCVPKKGGVTVVENEDNELIPTRIPLSLALMGCLPTDVCLSVYVMLRAHSKICMMAIFHDMTEETMEVFMDDFSVFGDSFSSCLSHLDKMLKWCEDTNLVLNWEKCHFMVKEGIVLSHKFSKSGIEVDRAKFDVIAKLHHLTSVKGVQSFLGHAGFYCRLIHYASKTMTDAQAHYTTTKKELLAVVYSFKKFQPYLVLSKTIVYTDHSTLKYLLAKQDAKLRLLRWILLLQEFDVIIHDKKGAENLAADHLSRIENPHQGDL